MGLHEEWLVAGVPGLYSFWQKIVCGNEDSDVWWTGRYHTFREGIQSWALMELQLVFVPASDSHS